MALENDEAAMWLGTLATATAGDMPRKISSGVIRKPPPMPNMPEMNPDRHAEADDDKDVDRQVGDRKVELHGAGIRRFERRGPQYYAYYGDFDTAAFPNRSADASSCRTVTSSPISNCIRSSPTCSGPL